MGLRAGVLVTARRERQILAVLTCGSKISTALLYVVPYLDCLCLLLQGFELRSSTNRAAECNSTFPKPQFPLHTGTIIHSK